MDKSTLVVIILLMFVCGLQVNETCKKLLCVISPLQNGLNESTHTLNENESTDGRASPPAEQPPGFSSSFRGERAFSRGRSVSVYILNQIIYYCH